MPARIAEAMGISEGTEVITRRRVLYDKETNPPEEIGASYIPGHARHPHRPRRR
ncbi:hypothetical protein [Nonomuraea cavernae]|uniref:UbiC transcription regulator-associated domain-containing protein n=1 Tax=Nonomuraea cavernae TaxID=2045107 RepID=A0A918DPI7_9ACTN|nr:hypothetical protein [Nonomuraea cavernae]GGO78628.1 hypothetical protein GCM10012289_61020 [Nonomuraea cavernae]